MKKTTWKYLVDAILFLSIVGLAVIGFLMGFVLPKGPASESAKYFLGLHRHQWGDIHLYLGIVFTVMAVLHIVLAWDWIKGKTRQIFGARWKAALLSAPALAVAILVSFWAYWAANPNPYTDYGTPRGERRTPQGLTPYTARAGEGEFLVTGQSTLADLNRQTGIPTEELARRLDLPPGVSSDETLGRLKRSYSFTIEQVRDAVTELSETRDESGTQTTMAEGLETPVGHIRPPAEEHDHNETNLARGRYAEAPSGVLITGQMSLYYVQSQTGVSARAIADRIGIPSGVPLDEQLGRLRKRYPFTIQEVREAVSELMIRY